MSSAHNPLTVDSMPPTDESDDRESSADTAPITVVRVAFDGPSGSGKTTAIRALSREFTSKKRGDLHLSEEEDGHTCYFDFMIVKGGLVAGRRVYCEIVTTPGDPVLLKRREALLARADLVVEFCDVCSQSAIDRSATALEKARHFLVDLPSPPQILLLVSGGKPGDELPGQLGVPDARLVTVESPEDVRSWLRPLLKTAADLALTSSQDRELASPDELRAIVEEAGPDEDHSFGRVETQPVDTRELLSQSQLILLQSDDARPEPEEPEQDFDTREFNFDFDELTGNNPSSSPTPSHAPLAAVLRPPDADDEVPSHAVPAPEVMPVMVWPEESREVLEAVPLRHVLRASPMKLPGHEGSNIELYRAGAWCLKTTLQRKYESEADGVEALQRLVENKKKLGDLAPPKTLLLLNRDADGHHWVWTLMPWMRTISVQMKIALQTSDFITRVWRSWAPVLVKAWGMGLNGVQMELEPSNFAIYAGEICYIDDHVDLDGEPGSLLLAVNKCVEQAEDADDAVSQFFSVVLDKTIQLVSERADAGEALRNELQTIEPTPATADFFGELEQCLEGESE